MAMIKIKLPFTDITICDICGRSDHSQKTQQACEETPPEPCPYKVGDEVLIYWYKPGVIPRELSDTPTLYGISHIEYSDGDNFRGFHVDLRPYMPLFYPDPATLDTDKPHCILIRLALDENNKPWKPGTQGTQILVPFRMSLRELEYWKNRDVKKLTALGHLPLLPPPPVKKPSRSWKEFWLGILE